MESHRHRHHHGHHHHCYEDDPHNTALHSAGHGHGHCHEQEHQHRHGHGHGHGHCHEQEHQHRHGDEYDYPERYEEEKEEMVNDPEVHGAPQYDSSVVRITNLPREADDHLRKQADRQKQDQNVRNEVRTMGQSNVDGPKAKIGPPMGLEEDSHSPDNTPVQTPSSYQSKVTYPTSHGGKEAEVDPLVSQWDTLKVHDASNPKPGREQRSSKDSGKNAVAAKMGYGGSFHEELQDSSKKPTLESATEYAHIVYDKGSSVGGYLSEKFKPGEEDRELTEVITDTLHRQKEAIWKTEEEKQEPQLGKVTESEAVTARLGPPEEKKREGGDAFASGAESSGQGVADRVKDAVSSWLGKSAGIQTAQESIGRSHVSDAAGHGRGGDVSEKTKEK